MSTLEEQIDEMILNFNAYEPNAWIGSWQWTGVVAMPSSIFGHQKHYNQVHELIEEAELSVCLTSPSPYIRGYRAWYEKSKNSRDANELFNMARRYAEE